MCGSSFLLVNLVSLFIEVFGEDAELPLGTLVFGAIGNVAAIVGALAESSAADSTLVRANSHHVTFRAEFL
jgi:hypothetical protein